MPSPAGLRDSTQIVVAHGVLDGMWDELEAEFTVTLHETETAVRIIGSPVEIKAATRFLSLRGVPLP